MFISEEELKDLKDGISELRVKVRELQDVINSRVYEYNPYAIYPRSLPFIDQTLDQRVDALYKHLGLKEVYTEGNAAKVSIEKISKRGK